ncbi:Short-chain membrane-associated dehydrogenase [uncultured Mycobacterium sp.]|uniref:Short-chain membrane-associated dehydrogenase n=1 Tax=uncultured Mycobacterium sp. TaxID=171292 RepID=A0A1Y5PP81_9MYCO|nr:Short-chain membrane-associated dehydrogenase [uncultured Mycobacterium sp.]
MPNVAVVTGAAGGMGQVACSKLRARGWAVAAVDLPGTGLERVAQETGAVPFPCDVTDSDQVQHVAAGVEDRLGPIQRLFNGAGIAIPGRVEDVAAADFARVMNVNYLGTVHWVQAVAPGMRRRRHGELALVASFAGWMPTPLMGAYTATKFAVVGLAETLALELRDSGIVLRCVCPPAVDTPMLAGIFDQGLPARMQRLSRPITAERVLDSLEQSLARPKGNLMVFPDISTTLLYRVRRWAPGLLTGAIARVTARR